MPEHMLARATLGAWRRQHGVDGWCDYARVAFAVALVEEARRRVLIDRLDSLTRFLVAGATVDQLTVRLADLLDELYPDLLTDFLDSRVIDHPAATRTAA